MIEVLERTSNALDRSYQVGAKEHSKILQEEIWSEYKKLVDQYIDEEAKNQFQEEQTQKQPQREPQNFDDLNEGEKEDYRQKARQKLSEAENDFNQKTGSRSTETYQDENGESQIRFKEIAQEDIQNADEEEKKTTQEEKEKVEREKQEAQQRAQVLHGQATVLRERKTGLTEGEQRVYNEHRQKVEQYIKQLVKDIERTFPPKKELGWTSGKPRGARIDAKKLAREVATEHGHFFKSREIQETRTAAFTLLVDISGSMYNQSRIPSALEAAVMMAEAFSRKDIPFEILVFAGHPLELKKFSEDYKGIAKKKMIGILTPDQESDFYGATDAGFSLDWAAKRLERRSLEEGIPGCLIMVTDGQPEPVSEHSGAEWDLREISEKWQEKFPVIGIGIGSEIAGSIQNYFGKDFSVAEADVSKLPNRLLEVLKNQFSRIKQIE